MNNSIFLLLSTKSVFCLMLFCITVSSQDCIPETIIEPVTHEVKIIKDNDFCFESTVPFCVLTTNPNVETKSCQLQIQVTKTEFDFKISDNSGNVISSTPIIANLPSQVSECLVILVEVDAVICENISEQKCFNVAKYEERVDTIEHQSLSKNKCTAEDIICEAV